VLFVDGDPLTDLASCAAGGRDGAWYAVAVVAWRGYSDLSANPFNMVPWR
jgi:hypothetical protein